MDPLLFHKALPFFFLPHGVALLLLLAAVVWRNRFFAAAALLILCVFGSPVVADLILHSLEDQYPYRTEAQAPAADAVFPLGGGIIGPRDHANGDAQWNHSAERFGRALDLFTAHHAPVLVLSRGMQEAPGEPTEGERLREIALRRGVPDRSIELTGPTMNTATEADALCGIATRRHWKRVLLVTSAFHMPRAMRLFSACPVDIVPVPVDYQTSDNEIGRRTIDRYFPESESLSRSERALREYIGILFYSVVRHGPALPLRAG